MSRVKLINMLKGLHQISADCFRARGACWDEILANGLINFHFAYMTSV